MSDGQASRREFLKMAGMVAGTGLVSQSKLLGAANSQTDETKPDCTFAK